MAKPGRPDPDQPPAAVGIAGLAKELGRLLRRGLPATAETAGVVLPNLRGVVARAVHPDIPQSRLDALNDLLPRVIAELSDENYVKAVRTLFGLASGTRRTSLMDRRRQAADLLGYNSDHFRTDIEPEMLRSVAELLHRDLLRYKSRVKRSVASLEPTGDTPRLTIDDLNAEEELISRIWQHVYGLRAEMIAHLRLSQEPEYEGQAEDHRQVAHQIHDALRELIQEYVKTYGELIRHGETEYAAEALERLAGWRM